MGHLSEYQDSQTEGATSREVWGTSGKVWGSTGKVSILSATMVEKSIQSDAKGVRQKKIDHLFFRFDYFLFTFSDASVTLCQTPFAGLLFSDSFCASLINAF